MNETLLDSKHIDIVNQGLPFPGCPFTSGWVGEGHTLAHRDSDARLVPQFLLHVRGIFVHAFSDVDSLLFACPPRGLFTVCVLQCGSTPEQLLRWRKSNAVPFESVLALPEWQTGVLARPGDVLALDGKSQHGSTG